MSAFVFLTVWFAETFCLVGVFGKRLWGTLSSPLRLYLVVGWSLVSIGATQMIFSPFRFGSFNEAALWFATAGIAVTLTGALNILNLGRQRGDAGLRRVCLAANLAITVLFVAVATHRGAEPPHDLVSIAFMGVGIVATLLSGRIPSLASPGPRGEGIDGLKSS